MKVICFILSIYVFALSAIPCCDDDGSVNGTRTEQTCSQSNKHENKHDCNGCSPFVTCSTCSGFTFAGSGYNFNPLTFAVETEYTFYQLRFIESYFAEIWQPPKIS